MKKLSYLILSLALLMSLSVTPALATEEELIHVFWNGDYVPAPTSTGPALGYYSPDSYRHMSFRWNDFSQEYNCNLCVQMWTDLESSGYASLEEALAARPQYLDERSVCIFYAAQEDLVYITWARRSSPAVTPPPWRPPSMGRRPMPTTRRSTPLTPCAPRRPR